MKGIKIMMRRYLPHHPYDPGLLILIVLLCHSFQPVRGQEDRYKGQRPYELDWAGRYEDDHVPLIDFESPANWTVDASDGSSSIKRSNEEIIWDNILQAFLHINHITHTKPIEPANQTERRITGCFRCCCYHCRPPFTVKTGL